MSTLAQISQHRPIFTLINTFEVLPGKQSQLVDLLRDITERVTRHRPGFLAACVHKSPDGLHVANYVQWQTPEDFWAAFHDPQMQEHMAALREITASVTPIFYDVEYVCSSLADSVVTNP